jgi:hypothetical protein
MYVKHELFPVILLSLNDGTMQKNSNCFSGSVGWRMVESSGNFQLLYLVNGDS